jgi:hypothetical protein
VPHGSRHSDAVLLRNTCDLKTVLTNPGPSARRGGSCAYSEAASRVALPLPTFSRRPYSDSRVCLTREPMLNRTQRGGVPSGQSPIAPWIAPQCPGWDYSARNGRTGSEVTEETCSARLTSQNRLERAPGRWPYTSRGSRCPFSRSAAWRKDGSGQHSAKE